MSTSVDNENEALGRRPRSSSEETRARVLQEARIAFCQAGFDHMGIREIAARAATDAAIVIRLFGSKEALFQEVAKEAFNLEPAFTGPRERIGEAVADLLLASAHMLPEPDRFDAFRFLLRSAASPVAAPIISTCLHANFVFPLAKHLGKKDALSRAALVTSCVLGFTTMRFALNSPTLQSSHTRGLRATLARVIQVCIEA